MTLEIALMAYLSRKQLADRTRLKMRHRLNCWLRHTSLQRVDQVGPVAFAAFRKAAAKAGLSARTIEETISDVARISGVNQFGERIRGWKAARCKPVPEIDTINRAYESASDACWPVNEKSRTPELRTVDNGTFLRAYLVLAFHTGLRCGDLHSLTWQAIGMARIDWQASKTARQHVYPIDDVVRRHLQPLREHSICDRVFPVTEWQERFVRRELRRVSCDRNLTPQAIRRCAITEWACASADAARLVHGCGLGVLTHYFGAERILCEAMPRRAWPSSFLTAEERETQRLQLDELTRLGKRLQPEQLDNLIKVGHAFAA